MERSAIKKIVGKLRQRKASEQAAIEKSEREAMEAAAKAAEAYAMDAASANASAEADLADMREALVAMIPHKARYENHFRMILSAEAEEAHGGPRNVVTVLVHNCPVCPQYTRQLEQQRLQQAMDSAREQAVEQHIAVQTARHEASSARFPSGGVPLGISAPPVPPGGSPRGGALNPNAKVWQPSAPIGTGWQRNHLSLGRPQQQLPTLGAVNLDDAELRRIIDVRVGMAFEAFPPHVTNATHRLHTSLFRGFWTMYHGPILLALAEFEAVKVKLAHTQQLFEANYWGRFLEDLTFDLQGYWYQLRQAWDVWNQHMLAVESECLWSDMLQVCDFSAAM